MTTIAIGCDPNARELKETIIDHVESLGYRVEDYGSTDTVYANVAVAVASDVAAGRYACGILICGTGIGMCITANKFGGIRAALALDELSAELSRSHNDSNVLCLSGDLVGHELGQRIARAWMETDFEGGRHERRLKKISDIDIRLDRVEGSGTQDA